MTPVTSATTWARFRDDFQERYLRRIDGHVARLTWTSSEVRRAQADGLKRLISYAVARSPFHRERLARVDVDTLDLSDLHALPVMTKELMMDRLDEVFTDRRLTRPVVEDAIDATNGEPVPILDGHVAFATGGSSGNRGLFVYDADAMATFLLSVTRSLVGRLRSRAVALPFEIAMVGAASAIHLTRAASACTEGIGMPMRIRSVPVTLPLQAIVTELNALQAPGLFGYPTMLTQLAAEQSMGRLKIAPLVITTTAETLSDEAATTISDAFGAPVVNNFACTEGLVGNSAPGQTILRFNSDQCIIELVDDENRPVPPGEPSSKVLLTNLYNLVQPLIRYSLSDRFVAADEDEPMRATVLGRGDEVLRYAGVAIHPHVIRSALASVPNVVDYVARQTTAGLDLDILGSHIDEPALTRRLVGALRAAGLSDPMVSVRCVEAMPRIAATGKLRRFVPLGG